MSKCKHGYKVWRKCPVCREDPERWERVLASHGLGINQQLTDNTNDPSAPEIFVGDDFAYLRQIVDKGDRFMEAHQIKKVRGFYENRVIPEWSQNNKRVREILLLAFPKMQTSQAQRTRAGRWMKFIYFYYRLNLPRPVILKEMGITIDGLEALARSLDRVSRGLNRNGKPRKEPVSVPPVRELGEGSDE